VSFSFLPFLSPVKFLVTSQFPFSSLHFPFQFRFNTSHHTLQITDSTFYIVQGSHHISLLIDAFIHFLSYSQFLFPSSNPFLSSLSSSINIRLNCTSFFYIDPWWFTFSYIQSFRINMISSSLLWLFASLLFRFLPFTSFRISYNCVEFELNSSSHLLYNIMNHHFENELFRWSLKSKIFNWRYWRHDSKDSEKDFWKE
jgi:hypothetical protein